MVARGMDSKYQGSKWIRREKRLAIYMRDGMACIWCGSEDRSNLTLDHLVPYSKGGGHTGDNLITSCLHCNSSRGDKDPSEFTADISILDYIKSIPSLILDVKNAKSIITLGGSWTGALATA